MKILLDTCVWGGSRKTLEAAGHDVEWTGDWPQDPGDDAILTHAYQEGRILVTLDKDFGELAVVFNRPHHGIVRLVNLSARDQGSICLEVLNQYGDELVS
jgi:predicted nuclease of predicted toxin-antitoxin system